MQAAEIAEYSRWFYRSALQLTQQKSPETAPFQGFSPMQGLQAHCINYGVLIDRIPKNH